MAEHPSVERLRRGYEAFATGDMATLSELFADDIVWHVGGHNPLSGDYKGKDQVFQFFATLAQESGGTLKIELHDVLANDEHAVALTRTRAVRGEKQLDVNVVHIFHVTPDGPVTEFWGFPEDEAAVDDFWS